MIEKHFTLNRADGAVDAAFSLEPDEMKMLLVEAERAWRALGQVTYGVTEGEKRSLQFRRSLYISADMKAGDKLCAENLRSIRPGFGSPPKHQERLIGKRVNRDVVKGTPMNWDLIG